MKKIWLALGAVLLAAPIVAYGANDTLVTIIDSVTPQNSATVAGSQDALGSSTTGVVTQSLNYGYNGTSWDRLRTASSTSAIGFAAGPPLAVALYGVSGSLNTNRPIGIVGDLADGGGGGNSFPVGSVGFNGTTYDRLRVFGSVANVGTGVQRLQTEEGYSANLNVTAATTVKATAGRVFKVNVIVAGATGQVCDNNGACAAANVVFQVPAVVGTYDINWPMATGIRVEPGAAQVIAISWQ